MFAFVLEDVLTFDKMQNTGPLMRTNIESEDGAFWKLFKLFILQASFCI